ncbi:cytochrome P450 [Butyriboletus roseoflavus]|nr:cytochrome P450 [Butyriboletus roseoflavus]
MGLDWKTTLISGAFVALAIRLSRSRTNQNLPPSIPGLPLLGNTLQLVNLTHLQLDEWKNKHGPIYSLNTLGGIIVVIANAAIASDILDKMSAMTSSRPNWIMANELMGRTNFLVAQKYGEKWRKHRRGAHEALHSPEHFFPVQEHEARLLVRDLVSGELKDDLEGNLRRVAASTIWRTVYGGPPLKILGDKSLEEINELADRILEALSPGGGIVDMIPILNHLPSSLAPFKQYADKFFSRANAFFMGVADEAIKRRLVFNDPSKLNFCAWLNDRKKAQDLSDEDVAWISGMTFIGGGETSASAMHYFILAMILHPHVGHKAQEELDTEVGDRPPTFGDRDRLPYIEAIVKEVLRWRPVAATGGPHVATEELTYQGYTIPKGAMIVNNLWSITHDPALFDDPDAFIPERFLESEDSKPRQPNVRYDDLAFGYGRRICVGRHVAVNTLFITIATLLWAFEFHKAIDDHGNEMTPPAMDFFNTGGTVRSKSFPFRLTIRSAGALERIHDLL